MKIPAIKILRNTDEWIGLLVLVCIGLFIAAALHAGLLSDWFRPTVQLRIVLPPTGSQGLSAGADVQLLGTRVGTVRRVVVDPNRIYAEAELDTQAEVFIKRDSKALVRKQFGLAGAAYLDISRGTGAPLDWHFAVIDAVTEPDPTENIGATVDQIKQKIFPVLDDAGRAMHALADTLQGIDQGHGNIGRLVKDEALAKQLGQIATNLKTTSDQLNATMVQVHQMVATTAAPNGLPALLRKANDSLASVQKATHDLAGATPQLPAITRNAATSTADLPALLLQTQASMEQLEKTLDQLRHTWPLSSSAGPEAPRLSPAEVTP
ncbi:MAG TPA: MlaD family protein [Stellaceae bacterium]|jgi:phospholipid/cholesterol/gamma-HCH transport system substrate-binding protein|nr:MlaD family protein [Stellaceae bacterium]